MASERAAQVRAAVEAGIARYFDEDVELIRPIEVSKALTLHSEIPKIDMWMGPIAYPCLGAIEFQVDVDRARVIGMRDPSARNYVPNCNEAAERARENIGLELAREIAHRKFAYHGVDVDADSLVQKSGDLMCLSSEAFFRFIWRERHDDKRNARGLVTLEILIHPQTGRVYLYKERVSIPSREPSVSADQALAVLATAGILDGDSRSDAMVLVDIHNGSGDKRLTWIVNVLSGERSSLSIAYVDAMTGELIPAAEAELREAK